jgi:hypothetical protein
LELWVLEYWHNGIIVLLMRRRLTWALQRPCTGLLRGEHPPLVILPYTMTCTLPKQNFRLNDHLHCFIKS